LAWASTSDGGVVAGLPDALAVGHPDGWAMTGWEAIDHGRFDRDSATLTWSTADGGGRSVTLQGLGRLPELFVERVEASIVAQWPVEWDGGRATIVARRNPGRADAVVHWRVVAPSGTATDTPEAGQALAGALRLALDEWDIA